ncbi:hypothetical protein ASD54_16690 [Rhizobium sp. Root149]|uniref:histidine kinase n=1 Tax=Rhizobium rhizoryzae TaxID=451876 RepID=A0A7W6PSY5_9HYPH|nr:MULTISPECIES: histidine kinase dimerization/phospho-acceptor domain-containing protein [Rhizobium]KQZ48503.1 hypothetical protein ASD54_16690 [Rhizobium sp. Root149]MBB4144270.1 two-component system OmpR family sensor kinase [Rhizobium rhizoryzae]
MSMPRPRSIARELRISLGLTLLAFWLLAAGLAFSVMQEEMGEVFDSALQETAERLAPLVIDDLYTREDTSAPRKLTALRENVPDEYLTYQVRDGSGRVLLHSHNVSADPYEAPLVEGFWSGGEKRIFTVAAVSGSIFVQVADSLEHRREASIEGGTALLLPLLLLLPASLIAVSWFVRRNVSEVDRLKRVIGLRDSGNLAPIDLKDLPIELEPIQQSVNLLIKRVDDALEAERSLTANSAHELRTPIAGALAQSQLLLSELEDGQTRDRARQVDAALRKLSVLTEKLLQLARADAGIGKSAVRSDLSTILDVVMEEFLRNSQSGSVLHYHRPERMVLSREVDPDAFAIAARNLVENALAYRLPDTHVDVHLKPDGLRVSNLTSPKTLLPPEKLRQRFVRGHSLHPGSGLGLAIVERLATQMGAQLELTATPLAPDQSRFDASIVFPDP